MTQGKDPEDMTFSCMTDRLVAPYTYSGDSVIDKREQQNTEILLKKFGCGD